jgi:hypothetical protein
MNRISVEHIIDDTSKEIYEFEKMGNTWHYVAYYYAHRNDRDDVWGDNWADYYETQRTQELDELALSLGYENSCDLSNYGGWEDVDKMDNIYLKYNPVCQKTIHGKPYYGGCSWGYGSRGEKYIPKMSEEDIIKEITNQVTKVKIKL